MPDDPNLSAAFVPAEFGLSAPSDAQAITLAGSLIESAGLMQELREETDLWWADHGCVGHTCHGSSVPLEPFASNDECSCEDVHVIEGWLRNQHVIRALPKARRRERRAKGAKADMDDTTHDAQS